MTSKVYLAQARLWFSVEVSLVNDEITCHFTHVIKEHKRCYWDVEDEKVKEGYEGRLLSENWVYVTLWKNENKDPQFVHRSISWFLA